MPSKAPKRPLAFPSIRLPKRHTWRLANGLTATAVQRGQLPLVALVLTVSCGSAQDPSGRHGLVDFTARLMRRGTQGRDADAVNDAIEFVGASLSIGTTEDFVVLRMTVPSEHLVPMLHLLAEIVRNPVFPTDEFESAQERELARLTNDLDDPALLADRAITKAVWGPHPYGHDVGGSSSHVQAFTRDEVARLHAGRFTPNVCSLFAVGRLDVDAFARETESAFASWARGPEQGSTVEAPRALLNDGKVVVVDKPDQTQTQVRIGGLAIPRGHPDFMPAHLANAALGGGFTSRLMQQIRVNRGLSYGVHSLVDAMKVSGWFGISTFTKTETTKEIIEVALGEARKIREKGLTPKELVRTQTYLAGLYPLRTESNEALAGSLAEVQIYGLGDEWIQNFGERIWGVTLQQARDAASRYFLASGKVIALVGNRSRLSEQVLGLGTLDTWEMDALR